MKRNYGKSPLGIKHYFFLKEALSDLNKDLSKLGQSLITENGDCIEIFKKYKIKHNIKSVWSHQETCESWVKDRNNRLEEWFY